MPTKLTTFRNILPLEYMLISHPTNTPLMEIIQATQAMHKNVQTKGENFQGLWQTVIRDFNLGQCQRRHLKRYLLIKKLHSRTCLTLSVHWLFGTKLGYICQLFY